ncbi:hypothetical protein BU26DRAFT_408714, partial [Trematosphaeria pertusa]
AFQYPPLPTGQDAIRILTLEPGEFMQPLTCTLASTAFATRPKYIALSYTWGPSYPGNAKLPTVPHSPQPLLPGAAALPTSREHSPLSDRQRHSNVSNHYHSESQMTLEGPSKAGHIMLNGQPFPIQQNLHLALLHIRSLTHPITLWVDYVCINQKDIAEVAMMSFIYTRILHVIAWLGTQDYQSWSDPFRGMAADWKGGHGHQFAAAVAKDARPHWSTPVTCKVLARLVESAYWTRLWIVQEVCLPRSLVLLYGAKIWAFEDFRDFREWEVLKLERARHSPADLRWDNLGAMLQRADTRDARHREETKLEVLIAKFSKSACS